MRDRWHWRAFATGGGSAFWLFLYGLVYLTRLHLQGFANVLLYLGSSFPSLTLRVTTLTWCCRISDTALVAVGCADGSDRILVNLRIPADYLVSLLVVTSVRSADDRDGSSRIRVD